MSNAFASRTRLYKKCAGGLGGETWHWQLQIAIVTCGSNCAERFSPTCGTSGTGRQLMLSDELRDSLGGIEPKAMFGRSITLCSALGHQYSLLDLRTQRNLSISVTLLYHRWIFTNDDVLTDWGKFDSAYLLLYEWDRLRGVWFLYCFSSLQGAGEI